MERDNGKNKADARGSENALPRKEAQAYEKDKLACGFRSHLQESGKKAYELL